MSTWGCRSVLALAEVLGATVIASCSGQEAISGRLPPAPLGLEMYVPTPEDNPLTAAKAELGSQLFRDRRLSRDGSISCSSCHIPEYAFGDTARVPRGVDDRRGPRNAPPLVNRGYGRSLFRDGRSLTLEDAVLRPIQAEDEMDLELQEAVRRVRDDARYGDEFAKAFGTSEITDAELARALSSYVRTLRSGDSPFDRYASGDSTALSRAAIRGRALFFGRAHCTQCHAGPYLTDERFHDTGVSWGGDPGREGVTADPADRGKFRTPGLRDVALTAPYMHDGSKSKLADVVRFYSDGGGANPLLDPGIRKLDLTVEEQADLVAFLEALTGGERQP